MPLVLGLLADGGGDPDAAHSTGRAHGLAAAGGDHAAGEAVAATLAALGFAPMPEEGRIALRACPFRDQVVRPGGRVLCALHTGIVAGVAEARGGALTDFTVSDPGVAPCTLAVRDTPPGGQPRDNSATRARKASPRSV